VIVSVRLKEQIFNRAQAWGVSIELSRRNPLWLFRLVQAVALVHSANKLYISPKTAKGR
jgi:hypothetical protein